MMTVAVMVVVVDDHRGNALLGIVHPVGLYQLDQDIRHQVALLYSGLSIRKIVHQLDQDATYQILHSENNQSAHLGWCLQAARDCTFAALYISLSH